MVIGKERTNWYTNHGSACTCVDCEEQATAQRKFDDLVKGRKIGRNEKCPCGSEKKFKRCHGH